MKRSITVILINALMACSAIADGSWNIDSPSKTIPNTEVSGEIFGKKFELGEATINKHMLSLKSKTKSKGWPDGNLMIFVRLGENDNEWLITPKSDNGCPHIHMRFSKEGKSSVGTLMFTGEYSMYLKLSEKDDKTVEGKISVSLPDYKKSYLIGTFTAKRK